MNQQKHHRHQRRRRWERMSERDTISIEPQAWCEMNGCPPAPFTYLSGCQTRWWAPQILRSSDHNWRSHPSVCHQHATENPSKAQFKAFSTTCQNNFGRWSSTPRTYELYFNLTRTSIIRRVLIIQCHQQFLLFVFSHVCENSLYKAVNIYNQKAIMPIYILLCGRKHFCSVDRQTWLKADANSYSLMLEKLFGTY